MGDESVGEKHWRLKCESNWRCLGTRLVRVWLRWGMRAWEKNIGKSDNKVQFKHVDIKQISIVYFIFQKQYDKIQ